ncbi:EAL domain-containing protein [Altericroceibacterium xinjiangense]|uniref:EAL domain-containing protein n=1 Tax=Altericroceibacterium xinjiangense TaxID=762261 RepID=UPI000F7E4296|nr:EAL domain-containing protein [Altericroceibacterium xinjiangense]
MRLSAENEVMRLDALHRLELLDTPSSEAFNRITRMAAQIFGLPIAAVSLTDRDRQWFKSRVGGDHCSIPRERAPCTQVAETTDFLAIPDLLADPYYADSVLAGQGIRFYCGASLVTREGQGLGALCVLGTEPRETSAEEVAALKDLAAMVMQQIELQHAFGRIDPLSGLPNRTQFLEDLDDDAQERPGERRLAVLVDLAPPEQLSRGLRVLGPGFIDAMVRQATPLIRSALKPNRVYHVASTQFAAIIQNLSDEEHYRAKLEESLQGRFADAALRPIASLAVGMFPLVLGETASADVLRVAYGAALDARASKALVSVHSAMSDDIHRRSYRLLADFADALTAPDQLTMALQPRIDLRTGECLSAEALLRWDHPELGGISPAEFIPIVEQSPLARAMTDWVLDHSLGLLSAFRSAGFNGRFSVNISGSNLSEHDLAARVSYCLSKHQLSPDDLELEVTESAAISENGSGAEQLAALAAAGFHIAIDDFGTGYSSLSYLQTIPADTIKLDRSFISDLEGNPRRNRLVRSMIGLFSEQGYRVVAEGVETTAVADTLREMGCHEAQGYGLARPMKPGRMLEWLSARHASSQSESSAPQLIAGWGPFQPN